MSHIASAWADFLAERPALKAAFDDWHRPKNEMPYTYETWPAAFMGIVGLSADDRAAWLDHQRNAVTIAGQLVDAEKIRLAA